MAFSAEDISRTTSDKISMSASHSSDSSQVAGKGPVESETPKFERTFSSEHGESTLSNSEDKIEKAIDSLEDDWENDPENARNWPTRKKWTAVCIVRRRFDLFFLGSMEFHISVLLTFRSQPILSYHLFLLP